MFGAHVLVAVPAVLALANRAIVSVPAVEIAPTLRPVAPVAAPAPLASAIAAPAQPPSSIRALAVMAAVSPAKTSMRGRLIHGAKPFANVAQAPLAGLEFNLRAFWEAGREVAAEPSEPIERSPSSERRAHELRLVKPGETKTAPAAKPAQQPPPRDWKHHARVATKVTIGTILVVLGIIMIPLPGPGAVLILIGLAILAKHFVWARRLLARARRSLALLTRPLRRGLRARRLARIRTRRAQAALPESD